MALGGIAWGWQRFGVRSPQPGFVAIEGLPGWRRVEYEGVSLSGSSATSAVLVGIGEPEPSLDPLPTSALCDALYGSQFGLSLPVAMFSDFFCPYCREVSARIAARAADPASKLSLTWHELPLLGPSSELAAKAALAADLQGGYADFQARLFATPFRPSPAHLASTAEAVGLDAGKLISDMDGAQVAQRLTNTGRAAETLGIWATPAMTIGRTLVTGAVSDAALSSIIADERDRSDGFRSDCSA